MTIVLLVTFFVLLLLDVPVAFCMILSSLAALTYLGIDPIMVGLETTRSLSSFYAFLAVPFFILAGELMSKGGLSERLIYFVKSLVGHKKAGLPYATVVSSQLFGAVSGASAATCAAIGGMMIPELEKNGYPRAYATALAACAGTTGALIPPGIAMIIYGTIAGVSIEQMFIAGIGPGILIGVGLMIVASRQVHKYDIRLEPKATKMEVVKRAKAALGAVLLAVIIFVGILGGIFTATEASAVAVAYSLIVGMFVYRQIKPRELPALFLTAAKTTAALSFVLACAALFAWTLGIGRIPGIVAGALLGGTEALIEPFAAGMDPERFALLHKLLILLVLNIILLIVGMVIDNAPALLILVPVLLPVADAIGMGSGLPAIQFGMMVVSNLIIGVVTPPVGTTLYVASGVGRVEISELVPHVLRFLPSMVLVQLLVTYVPWVTTGILSLMQ